MNDTLTAVRSNPVKIYAIALSLIFSCCVFNAEENEYLYFRHTKVIDLEGMQITDQGFYGFPDVYLWPYMNSSDGFYLVESPEELEDVFEYFYPDLAFFQNLFPENGMLLIHSTPVSYGWVPHNHTMYLKGDTLILDESVYHAYSNSEGSDSDGVYSFIGIVPCR